MAWHGISYSLHGLPIYHTLGYCLSPSCVEEHTRSLVHGAWGLKTNKDLWSMKMLQNFIRIGKYTYYFKSKIDW